MMFEYFNIYKKCWECKLHDIDWSLSLCANPHSFLCKKCYLEWKSECKICKQLQLK